MQTENDFDPNASYHDTTEQRIIHRDEIAQRNWRDTRSLVAIVSILVVVAIAALGIGLRIGTQQEATYAQAAQTTTAQTSLSYIDPHGEFTITVQRINPGLLHETDFRITVATHYPGKTPRTYQFDMSAATALDGHMYVLHYTLGKHFYPTAAVLVLSHPIQGSVFTGGATLYLSLGRVGQFALSPSNPNQGGN